MPTLQETLASNPNAGFIIPVIDYFNQPAVRDRNPFEALAIASILRNRELYWNNGNPPSGEKASYRWCCNSRCCRYIKITNPCPNPLCGDDVDTSDLRTGGITLHDLLVNAAAESRLGSPWTPIVRTFEQQLAGMSMNASNDWIFFQQMVDAFYDNVDFIPALFQTSSGDYTSLYATILDGDFRPGTTIDGITVRKTADGADGSTKAVVTVTADLVLAPADDQKYWTMFSDATNRWIPWIEVDASGAPPPAVTPIVGIIDNYVKIALTTGTPPADIATAISNALNLAPGWAFDSVTTGGVSDVIITATTTGSRPAPDFTNLPAHDTWAGAFVDGTTSVAHKEMVEIAYDSVAPYELSARWFKLYHPASTDGELFYYQNPGTPIDPATFGVAFDSAHAIVLDFKTAHNIGEVQILTNRVILGTGFWVYGVEPCDCSCKDPGCTAGNQCSDPCLTQLTTVAPGTSTDPDPGTAAVGDFYAETQLIAPDGTVYPGTYTSDIDYMNGWNRTLVPTERAKGKRVPYIKLVGSAGRNGACQYACVGEEVTIPCDPNKVVWVHCGNSDTSRYGFAPFMLFTDFLSVTDDIPFNRPGTGFFSFAGGPVDTSGN